MTWRRAKALERLEGQLRAEAPGITLGDIRDPNGSSSSDHNPWRHDANGIGVVRAVDVMTGNGQALATNLAAKLGRHPAMGHGAYVIWNRRIISADRRSEGWRPYTGPNPHTDHVHLSIALDQRGYDSPAAWGSLFRGTGNLGGSELGATTVGTSTAYNTGTVGVGAATGAGASAVGGISNAALTSVLPDEDAVRRLVIYGVALFGGVALIGVGLAKTIRPHTDAVIREGQAAAMNLIPQGRAAKAGGAATATTKGL